MNLIVLLSLIFFILFCLTHEQSCKTENCHECSERDICTTCMSGYSLSSDGKSCNFKRRNRILNCISSWVDPNGIIQCCSGTFLSPETCYCRNPYNDSGSYYIDSNNTCHQCLPNCESCNSATSCTSCNAPLFLNGSQCVQCPLTTVCIAR